MTATTEQPAVPSAARKRDRRRKLKAVLAAGVVLGVGAAVTLAAWNDSEFAKSTFTAANFNLEGTADALAATGWTDHNSGGSAASLTFSTSLIGILSPTATVYAPYTVRLDSNTTVNAKLTLASVDASGDNKSNYTYSITSSSLPLTCSLASGLTGTPLVTNVQLDAPVPTTQTAITVSKPALAGTPGANVYLCLAVTGKAGLIQGKTATAVWEFKAVSDDPTA